MSTETLQTNEYGEGIPNPVEVEIPASGPILLPASSTSESAEDAWQSLKAKASTFFANAGPSLRTFFNHNQQLLINLGWILLAVLGLKLLLTTLDAVDDIPLISPLLKLIGLVYSGWFVWRYLLRANNRQELTQMVNQTKAELFGNRS